MKFEGFINWLKTGILVLILVQSLFLSQSLHAQFSGLHFLISLLNVLDFKDLDNFYILAVIRQHLPYFSKDLFGGLIFRCTVEGGEGVGRRHILWKDNKIVGVKKE